MFSTLVSLLVGAMLAGIMGAIAISDWRSYRVPDRLTALALALRGVDMAVARDGLDDVLDAGLRAAAMAVLFYLFRAGYRRWRAREGLGLGDVKLAAVAGAWVDWRWLPDVIEAAALFGLALAFYRARRAGFAANRNMKLPFAAGFAPAIWLGWGLGVIGF